MLSINTYSQKYIDDCRAKVNALLSTYKNLLSTARKQSQTDEFNLNTAIKAFEKNLFQNMVLVLDNYFCNRSRMMEGKDGNVLNEVRVLGNSIMHNNTIMMADKTIKLDPTKSVLKYRVGDEIKLNEIDFLLLSKAFFAEIEKKYL